MRTVSYFTHKSRKMHIYQHHSIGPHGQTFYRAAVDGEELPVDWPNVEQLEFAIRRVLDEDKSHAGKTKSTKLRRRTTRTRI
jgi:hypothetical protein